MVSVCNLGQIVPLKDKCPWAHRSGTQMSRGEGFVQGNHPSIWSIVQSLTANSSNYTGSTSSQYRIPFKDSETSGNICRHNGSFVLFLKCNETFANTRIYSDFSIRFVLKTRRNVPNNRVSAHATFVLFSTNPKSCIYPSVIPIRRFVSATYRFACILLQPLCLFSKLKKVASIWTFSYSSVL